MFFSVKMEEKFIDVIFSFRISVNLMQMHLFFFCGGDAFDYV